MERRQFRFINELFAINGIYNIPGLIILSGHGYGFKTYCCKTCGEIFVVDNESLRLEKQDMISICKNKTCPQCNDPLETCLVNYPENIFHDGKLLKNNNQISKSNSADIVLREMYVLS